MPSTLIQIDEYEVMYSANAFVPRIWLKHEGKYVGQLTFKPNGTALARTEAPDAAITRLEKQTRALMMRAPLTRGVRTP